MNINADNPMVDQVLKGRFDTLHRVALELGQDPDASALARWLSRAREELTRYRDEQKSKRRAAEAEVVAEAYELAAGLVFAFVAEPEA